VESQPAECDDWYVYTHRDIIVFYMLIMLLAGEIFFDECNVLIGYHGILNRLKMADILGRDTFKGNLIHPAKCDHSVDLTGKKGCRYW
jgi:hypothetical protein